MKIAPCLLALFPLLVAPATFAQQATVRRNVNLRSDPSTQVYNPQRLIVKQECIAVTGTIVDASHGQHPDGVRHEADGHTNGWIDLDPQFKSLLNAGNMSNEGRKSCVRNRLQVSRDSSGRQVSMPRKLQ